MPDSTPERDKALKVHERYLDRLARLRGDLDLTDDARRRRMAEEWNTARAELDELQKAERARLSKREVELERKLFGLGSYDGVSQAISTRDAQDRAAQLTRADQATELLRRAERNGDDALARAVAHHALQQSRQAMTPDQSRAWDAVLGEFVDTRPSTSPIVEELALIERLTGAQPVFGPYSRTKPLGVTPADINATRLAPAGAA